MVREEGRGGLEYTVYSELPPLLNFNTDYQFVDITTRLGIKTMQCDYQLVDKPDWN